MTCVTVQKETHINHQIKWHHLLLGCHLRLFGYRTDFPEGSRHDVWKEILLFAYKIYLEKQNALSPTRKVQSRCIMKKANGSTSLQPRPKQSG